METRSCESCRVKPAAWFCTCTKIESCLCDECLLNHSRLVLRQGHHTWPISFLPRHKNLKYFDRQEAFPCVHAQALSSVEEVDRAIADLTAKVEELKTALTALCREKVSELAQLKAELGRDVEQALREVEASLAENHPRLTSYAALFRDMVERPRSIQLFTYRLECSSQAPLVLKFGRTKLREDPKASPKPQISAPPAPLPEAKKRSNYYASVSYDNLTLYDLNSKQTSGHRLAANLKDGCSFIELDQTLLLCLGSKPASTAASALDLTTFHLTELQALSEAREAPGVGECNAFIYAFGGIEDSGKILNSCEKWSLAGGRWSSVQSMKYPRAYFTPCQYQARLYLMSTLSHSAVEVFLSETEAFEELAIVIPGQLRLGWRSVAFVTHGELCVLTEGEQVARWKMESSAEFQVSNTKRPCWSTQPPRREGEEVLIAYDGQVVKFNLETFAFVA